MQVTGKVVVKKLSVLQTLKLVYAHSTGIHFCFSSGGACTSVCNPNFS